MANVKPEDLLIDVWEKSIREDSNVKISSKYFPYPKQSQENHKLAITLFRYVFSVLEWTPHDVMNFISKDIIEKLHLESAYNQLIFPAEVSPRSNPNYIAKLCYPDALPELSRENIWLMTYQKVLSGGNFKKDFFTDENRYKKARLFLNWYLINHPKKEFTDLHTTYDFFASKKGKTFLKSIKLEKPCEQLFESPLEYFHESLPDDGDEFSKDNDYFEYADFKRKLELKRSEEKSK